MRVLRISRQGQVPFLVGRGREYNYKTNPAAPAPNLNDSHSVLSQLEASPVEVCLSPFSICFVTTAGLAFWLRAANLSSRVGCALSQTPSLGNALSQTRQRTLTNPLTIPPIQ